MKADSQDLKTLLLSSDDDYRRLATKHQELESRLLDLSSRPYLSEPEQLEEVTLKKRKLQVKDQMEDIVRRHRSQATAPTVATT